MNKQEIREELIEEMIAECKQQIKNKESKRDTQYSDDPDQVRAFNMQIEYHKFMIARLEGYEERLSAGITMMS